MAPARVRVLTAGRARPDQEVTGDGWHVDETDGVLRVALIDGLGHGPDAAEAAEAAREALRLHPMMSPALALGECHRTMRRTRGAAITIARIDAAAGTLDVAGVGNVEARLLLPRRTKRFITQRGIVGHVMREPRTESVTLDEPWSLIMHSDGISSRWEDAVVLSTRPGVIRPDALSALLAEWSRPYDDATVVAACSADVDAADSDRA